MLQRKSYGQALFDVVCQRLDLLERDYFACSFVDANNVKVFLLTLLMTTLKPQSNTVIGTLAVDGWAVTFGTARRGLGGLGPRPVPSSLYQM